MEWMLNVDILVMNVDEMGEDVIGLDEMDVDGMDENGMNVSIIIQIKSCISLHIPSYIPTSHPSIT